ncbi:TrkH family potassium uptake protein [Carnobacterium inhibens]|uniref:Potassium transporter n=2 Tax=Carnobacterium inhibens TaxID=147709 RepID=U5SAC1_9LACT|nr:potassium transporter TrkG [Carnobacterium inhibens]AGY82224.1 potassium transporter [Carnobacterium inhibens subsp. gilichinskyi]MBC9824367.1 potassium transporter [Carnobacterium inhibens]
MFLKRLRRLPPAAKIVISFATVIFIGSLLLTLPISNLESSETTYFDNLFTAVSMVCVTGLFTLPVATSFTVFGQIVCIVLMQIGGIGLMTILATFIMRIGRKMRFSDTIAVKEALNRDELGDFKTYLASIIKYTAIIEGTGMLLLALRFVPEFGFASGLFVSLFLAVSAFCNAGFDNLGAYSLQEYVQDPLINLVITTLIILGGIGFSVWFDVTHNIQSIIKNKCKSGWKRSYRMLKIHTRLAINMTLGLIVIGTLVFLVVEWNNPNSIGNFTFGEKVLASFFQTVTMRTAGFATLDYELIKPFSLFFFIGTMFIGGSPGGAAGGIKTTTFALVALLVISEIKGQKHVNYSHHTIPIEIIRRAIVIVATFSLFLIAGVSVLMLVEDQPFLYLLFEAVSALATVGVSVNLTPELSHISQVVLMILMFIGRIGPITILLSLSRKSKKTKDQLYAKTTILIG